MSTKDGRLILMAVILFFLNSSLALAQVRDGDPHTTGLKPFSPEQEVQFKREHKHIKSVRLNRFGFDRVNEERSKRHIPQLEQTSFVNDEDDIEAAPINAASALGDSLSTASAISSTSTAVTNAVALPVGVDNSATPWFPPVRSQGAVGSCVAWATTYYQMTYMNAMSKGLTVNTGDNTHIFSPKWTYNLVNGGADTGAYFSDAYNVLASNGAAKWSEFPYDANYLAWDLTTTDWENAIYNRTNTVQYVNNASSPTGLQQIKQLLTNGYILVYGTYINSWQYTTLKNDPSTPDDDATVGQSVAFWQNGYNGGHAMTIVGFNDAVWTDINGNGIVDPGEKGAFKIVNSWGTGWGKGGFIWLAYDALSNPSKVAGGPNSGRVGAFQGDMVYQLVPKTNYSPKAIAEFTVNHLKRNQLDMILGVSSNTVTSPTSSWYPAVPYSDGGALAFNGTTSAVNGTFALDYTDLLGGTYPQRFYMGMADTTAGNPATLSSWKLIDLVNGTTTPATIVPLSADATTVYSYVDYIPPSSNKPPTAVITYSPSSPMSQHSVSFSGAQSTDSDGTIASYSWNLGDGATGSTVNTSHTYQAPGNYSVTLTVTDNLGLTGTKTVVVVVAPDPNQIIAPSNLSTSVKGRVVTLYWKDNSNNEQGFYVDQGTTVNSKIVYTRVGQTAANLTNMQITVSAPGSYYYRVQGFNLTTNRVSNYSSTVGVRIN